VRHSIAPDAFQLEFAANYVSGGRSAEAGTFYAAASTERLKGKDSSA